MQKNEAYLLYARHPSERKGLYQEKHRHRLEVVAPLKGTGTKLCGHQCKCQHAECKSCGDMTTSTCMLVDGDKGLLWRHGHHRFPPLVQCPVVLWGWGCLHYPSLGKPHVCRSSLWESPALNSNPRELLNRLCQPNHGSKAVQSFGDLTTTKYV